MNYTHIATYIIAAGQSFIAKNEGDESKAADIAAVKEAMSQYDAADCADHAEAIDALDTIASYLA
jgi:hypothetical protein